jgi:hypothetical protein
MKRALYGQNAFCRAMESTRQGARPSMNELHKYAGIFDDITPWSGVAPPGFFVDFLGTLTAKHFVPSDDRAVIFDWDRHLQLERPYLTVRSGADFWFEAANWVLSVREARDRYVMITLGALHGYQAVGACRALQKLNPLPYKLVAVEPIPQNMEWVRCHMRDNGIDPAQQWLIQAAIGPNNAPIFFPVGAPGVGGQNCVSTNEEAARKGYLDEFIAQGRAEEALTNLLLHNTTGLQKEVIRGTNALGEIRLVSAVTLRDVLGPFERVDLLESDIQESEILVFPPFLPLLKRKGHRIHIGTHGKAVHDSLLRMFIEGGWDIVFNYGPESVHETALGAFSTNDGVLSVRNPDV